MLRNRSLGEKYEASGHSNFAGEDYIIINATTPEDEGKEEVDGVQKKKTSSQKKFEFAI